jgi:hypothetical protein
MNNTVIVWLIYPTGGDVGHYVTTIARAGQVLEIFDPYGERVMGLDLILSHLPRIFVRQYRHARINKDNYQGPPNKLVNDCGQWAALRATDAHLSEQGFYERRRTMDQFDISDWAQHLMSREASGRQGHQAAMDDHAERIEQLKTDNEENAGSGGAVENNDSAETPGSDVATQSYQPLGLFLNNL